MMIATSTNNVDILMSGMVVKQEPRTFSQSGEYLFTTTSTNKYAKVSVDNQVVFEHLPSDPTPAQGKIYLGAGQHMVKIETLAGDKIQLQWYPIGSTTLGIVARTVSKESISITRKKIKN